ncbi:MAG: sigma-70 family RNA polymerase sigma factor [Kangiellaceae bacterium]|nr:sigma-70 family RNA polymerase sigma factor [Kangiellaceae bacterium]MCW8998038.1 sigma-70 family RNA polymerase sigma factor [Kangiellaceae bacterium]
MSQQSEAKFIQIIQDNKDKIYRICKAHAVLPLEPQDLLQEVICEVWRSIASFNGRSEISTWVYRIALNVCYRLNRKQKRNNLNAIQLESVKIETVQNESKFCGDEDAAKKDYRLLLECISALDDLDRSIMMLHLEELSYRDISEIVGISENHVAVKVKRAKSKLLKCFNSKLETTKRGE